MIRYDMMWYDDHIHIIRMLTDAGPDLEDETRDVEKTTTHGPSV